MGSSARKKKDKKKDFQKLKLKVGKARPKPTNITDTSFKAKSITLSQQSLTTAAPSANTQFTHHLSLLTSRSDNQRRESLTYLTSSIAPQQKHLPQPVALLLPKLLPLTLDGSNSVRAQLVKLLQNLPPEDIRDHMEKISLYIRAGITHLATDIRNTALEILEWALDIDGNELVSCPGGWVKTLKTIMTVLAWNEDSTIGGWTSSRAIVGRSPSKSLPRTLGLLAALLRAGLVARPSSDNLEAQLPRFPLWDFEYHIPLCQSNTFGYLNLFGPAKDQDSQGYENIEDRRRIFRDVFEGRVAKGVLAARREGGEVGRAAATVTKALDEGLNDKELRDK
ncbi:MAG: hypothetical protein Q9195_002636 [Heterodermia aff. obscurata]